MDLSSLAAQGLSPLDSPGLLRGPRPREAAPGAEAPRADALDVSPWGHLLASWASGQGSTWTSLSQALDSGDLSAARQAFDALTPRPRGFRHAGEGQEGEAQGPRAALKADLRSLGEALRGGSLDEARAAFQRLQRDFEALRDGFHPGPKAQGPKAPEGTRGATLDLTVLTLSWTSLRISRPGQGEATEG